MPFTHSYSSSAIAARSNQNQNRNRGSAVHTFGTPTSGTGSSVVDASSSRIPSLSKSTTTAADSPSTSDHESTARSRLFSSGRKSPDPFRRFRRLSSSNSLNIASAPPAPDASQSFDSQQSHSSSAYTDTTIPAHPSSSRSTVETPRSGPPPLPSSSTKPAFQRPKRTKSSSISILSSGLGLRSRDQRTDPSSTTDARRRHRKSASLSGSDVDFSASALESQRSATSQPMLRSTSPSPSLSESIYSLRQDATTRSSALPLSPPLHQSKQHKQAWYQAQQKTIELDNPHNRERAHPDSDNAKMFPLNVTVADHPERIASLPDDAPSPRPLVETFLSEQEMLDAGIHIIRRRDDDTAAATSTSSKDSPGLATPRLHDQATMPSMPPRLHGAEHPDFLEMIDSPVHSKQPSPQLHQLIDPPASSANMQRALSHSHNKSSSGSLSASASSAGSTDQLPHDAASLNNDSTSSLSSGSKSSFSFAKLRRGGGAKPSNAASSSRPSTANSSTEDVIGSNRTFLFPSRNRSTSQTQTQMQMQQQQQHHASSNGSAATPGYLTPGPGSSASPFLNKHSATVGRASGSLGSADTAKKGLAQVFSGRSNSAATVGPSFSGGGNVLYPSTSNGVAPPKPPKPKPSLLTAFPRSGSGSSSSSGSVSAPNTAPLPPMYTLNKTDRGNTRDALLQPPASAGVGNSIYRNIAHSRSQEAVAEARLDAEALRASAGTPLPPPRRLNPSRGGGGGAGGSFGYSQYTSPAMARSGSSNGGGGVVGALGHVGQLGAAMGRKGWDFMKTLQTSTNAATGAGLAPGRSGASAYSSGYRNGGNHAASAAAAENEPTRQWLMLLDGTDYSNGRASVGGVFGAPLKDAVLRSRLSSLASEGGSNNVGDHLGVPDLGQHFSATFLESPRVTPRASVAGAAATDPLSREEARHLFLPRVVVRCIESLEKWGPSEEGIYRISGRSSHTSKLRLHFSDPRNDLRLDEINPADLDINSVCSLLKSFLRELPEPLIPLAQSQLLDQAVARLLSGTEGAVEAGSGSGGKLTDTRAAQIDPEKVADELAPLMRHLPVYNWYMLRELTYHLGMLAAPSVVASTKMPISNLTLVLAPTVSISLPLLQVLVRHREVVFAGPVPTEDVVAAAAASVAALDDTVKQPTPSLPPPKPAKPAKLSSPSSKLPVMVRKRASSMGLAALLSSPTRSKAAEQPPATMHHRRAPSTTPSIDLPAYLAEAAAAASSATNSPVSSPTFALSDPYERPSTSLGHFTEVSTASAGRHATSNSRDRFGGSRDAALRFNALALDDDQHRRSSSSSKDSTPIARYYARMRAEAQQPSEEIVNERDGAKTPLALSPSASLPQFRDGWGGENSPNLSLLSSESSSDVGRSGRTSALDRPRPPTSSTAGFFAGRSRRQGSSASLSGIPVRQAVPKGSENGGMEEAEMEEDSTTTKPLKIVKKVSSSAAAQ